MPACSMMPRAYIIPATCIVCPACMSVMADPTFSLFYSSFSSPSSAWNAVDFRKNRRLMPMAIVRVRWVNHKCKVSSNEFDREATLCSWWVYICLVVLSSRSFQQFLERRRSSEGSTEGPHSNEGLSLSWPQRRPQAKYYQSRLQPFTAISQYAGMVNSNPNPI
jgi:hypothetical protein